jgi:hypothetical protein
MRKEGSKLRERHWPANPEGEESSQHLCREDADNCWEEAEDERPADFPKTQRTDSTEGEDSRGNAVKECEKTEKQRDAGEDRVARVFFFFFQ